MKLEDVPPKQVDKFIREVSRDLSLRESEKPIVEVTNDVSGTRVAEVGFDNEVGRFKIAIRPSIDWTLAKATVKHELGHIKDYRNYPSSEVYSQTDSEEWTYLRQQEGS